MPPHFLSAASFTLVTLTGAFAAGCGVSYQPARSAPFELDSSAQIDDVDIQKAYAAKPQMPAQVRVAYYSFDPRIADDLDRALGALPGVAQVYRIPSLLVNGQRRIDIENPRGQAPEVTVKKLRLLAARAHADVLVVVDHAYAGGGANGLAAFNVLLVPIFFLPFVDTTVKGYAEGYVVDVRNGYLYGHVTEDDTRGKSYSTIYDRSATELADEQWVTLRTGLLRDLGAVLRAEGAGAQTKGGASGG